MKRSNTRIFLLRFTVVFLVHLVIKSGDYTYSNVFEISLRSFVFSFFFIIYWLIIWYTSAFINDKIRNHQNNTIGNKNFRLYILFLFHIAFGFLVSFLANYLYRIGDVNIFHMESVWEIVPVLNPELTISLLLMYIMLFSFDIYIHSIIDKKENQLQIEKLKQENTLAKYLNLKTQIEPHFLFNSLSVLSSIIYSDVDLAADFILRLSKILRYVIEKNDLLTVPLKDEIAFVNNYIFLIKTRFEDGIILENSIDKNVIDTYSIPPVSLQLLVENSIKHNKFSKENPLVIKLNNNKEYLIITNNLNKRNDIAENTKQGLANLSKRFSYLSENPVKVEETTSEFIVSLPIISDKNDESFNF
jgi:two-component system, LytTR family, sensor kinase